MPSPWILTRCTQHQSPTPVQYTEPDAESLIHEYLAGLNDADRQRFREETDAVCQVLNAALHVYLDAHPDNLGPWMWTNAAAQFAYVYERNLEELMTRLDADEAVEDCDA